MSQTLCDETKVQDKTREYWGKEDGKFWYIDNLLPLEMQCAETLGKLPDKPCHHLVLLVGHSIEPLLQAVWAYRPEQVTLIVNRDYGDKTGDAQAQMVKQLIQALPHEHQPKCIQPSVINAASPEDLPAQTFQCLHTNLRNGELKDVVIDITGGKKSMVAGAFLFAAFSNLPVTYVDFRDDKYDTNERRPYGYAPQFGQLDNPYQRFALRDWEKVRELYQQDQFQDARNLLVGIENKGKPIGETSTILESIRMIIPEAEETIQKTAQILRCYENWDAGLYNEAAAQAQSIKGFTPPDGVIALGGNWFTVRKKEGRFDGGPRNFYLDTPEFQAYVFDELARLERLINYNQDYRSALIRAGSLNEVVMVARLVRLMPDGLEKDAWLKELQDLTPDASEVFDFLKRAPGDYHVREHVWKKRDELPDVEISITLQMQWHQNLDVFGVRGSWKIFLKIRNNLAHKHYSPPEKWARDAYNFVKANIEDFWGLTRQVQHPWEKTSAHALPWSELCRVTGLDRFLTPNLL